MSREAGWVQFLTATQERGRERADRNIKLVLRIVNKLFSCNWRPDRLLTHEITVNILEF